MSDVNIIISVKNLASKEINQTKKDLDSLAKKTSETADSTSKSEKRAAEETKKAEKARQQALKESQQRMQALGQAAKFLYTNSLVTGAFSMATLYAGGSLLKLSAESDNIRISFQNTFSDKAGSILDSIRQSTKGIVDDTTLMKDAIKTNMSGIRDVNMLPEIFKLGAVASQRLGIDASEGINLARKAVVEFNEGAMEQLGIINKLDPAYKTQMAIIEKSTKGLGQYLTIQSKLNYVLDQARKRYGDNFDVLETNQQAFQLLSSSVVNLRNNIGYLLGDAIAPLARGLGMATNSMIQFIQQIRVDKVFKDATGPLVKFTAALAATLPLAGGLALALSPLGPEIAGPVGLVAAFLSLTGAVKLARTNSEDFVETVKHYGQMAIGVYELVSSFFNLKDGTAQINKELADMIGSKGMTGVLHVAQFVVRVINGITDVADGLQAVLGPLFGLVSDIASSFASGLGLDTTKGLIHEIGIGIGSLITVVRYLLIPFEMVANVVTRLQQNVMALIKVLFHLPELVSKLATGKFAEAANIFKQANFVTPIPMNRQDIGMAMGPLAGVIAPPPTLAVQQTPSMTSSPNMATSMEPTATTESSLESTSVPKEEQKAPQVVVQAPSDPMAARIFSQAVRHLESIDSKVGRSKTFEDKLLTATSR